MHRRDIKYEVLTKAVPVHFNSTGNWMGDLVEGMVHYIRIVSDDPFGEKIKRILA